MADVAIIATRRFQFGAGYMRDGTFDRFVTTPNVTMMMPERYMSDPLFIKAHELGLLMVVSSPKSATVAHVEPVKVEHTVTDENTVQGDLGDSGDVSEVDPLDGMTIDQLVEKATELGIEIHDGIGKKKLKKLIREKM